MGFVDSNSIKTLQPKYQLYTIILFAYCYKLIASPVRIRIEFKLL